MEEEGGFERDWWDKDGEYRAKENETEKKMEKRRKPLKTRWDLTENKCPMKSHP